MHSGDHQYIISEKLRSSWTEAQAPGNLRVKEVRISEHERFPLLQPEGADRTHICGSHATTQSAAMPPSRASLAGTTPIGLQAFSNSVK
jgi:hypothetical protein